MYQGSLHGRMYNEKMDSRIFCTGICAGAVGSECRYGFHYRTASTS